MPSKIECLEPLLPTTDATKLSFENDPENNAESRKRTYITNLIESNQITLEKCRAIARSEYGLVNDELRRTLWPLLVEVDASNTELPQQIDDLKLHSEYNQVVLDVNRSLKRFPPGIPYEQRIALQDQLTVLIMRVINKYPNLKYYQGYHDVAITFLLVVGEKVSFAVMEKLSTSHFEECMHETMDPTQRRLMFIYPIIDYENPTLYNFLKKSSVGTLFALPWVLTWFGHSLKSYKCVVRLYDFFLASPMYFSIYVTAAIVLYRAQEILKEDCDMASIHCLLSQLPDEIPFEEILKDACVLYDKYPLNKIEKDVEIMQRIELEERQRDIERCAAARKKLIEDRRYKNTLPNNILPTFLLKKSFIVTTTFSILFGICAYYYKNQYWSSSVS